MSEFHRLLLGLHAQARRIDRDQALLGALGVAANAYPHQLDSVHRMVTATTCRWLLADEVGLGKTIQAIMVMRALAAQSPAPHNVALVIPDDLVSQWEEELLTRGHTVAIAAGEDGAAAGNLVMRLVRPSRITAGTRLAAEKIDLIIVDEFTKLAKHVQAELISAARTVPSILVLTATPALHLAESRKDLMRLLEPEADRTAAAQKRDILDVLADRETSAIQEYFEELQDAVKYRSIADAYGIYRRLIRTERVEYPDVLPRRVYQPISNLAPTDDDVNRARAARAYVDAARSSGIELRTDRFLQVAGRSRSSLNERASKLAGTSPELKAARQQVQHAIRDGQGDARLDALIDHIRSVTTRDADARVVVVAEDSPTTDYLRDVIEKLAEVKVAQKRRPASYEEDLAGQVTTLREALEDFISGEAKVLVAADVAQEGHNLQFADELVFFALPWSPHAIQQWIGRIDRLGAKGKPANRRITITPIVVQGSIEEKILDVLRGTGVFQKSEVFDESEWEAISRAIEAAAYGGADASWSDAAQSARALGDDSVGWLNATRLPPKPRTTLAVRRHETLANRLYALPAAPASERPDWYSAREDGAGTMLALAREDYLDIRKQRMGDQRFRTMWYRVRLRLGDLIIPELDERGPQHRQAYLLKRDTIESPPRTNVVEQQDGKKRRLHFFDHGSSLHDGIAAAFEKQAPPTDVLTEFSVAFPDGHPALRWTNQRLLVVTAELDLGAAIGLAPPPLPDGVPPGASIPEQEVRKAADRVGLMQFQADRRWLIDLAPSQVLATVLVESGDSFEVDESALCVLHPFCRWRERAGTRQAPVRFARGAAQRSQIRCPCQIGRIGGRLRPTKR